MVPHPITHARSSGNSPFLQLANQSADQKTPDPLPDARIGHPEVFGLEVARKDVSGDPERGARKR